MIEKIFKEIYVKSSDELNLWQDEFDWPISWSQFLNLEKEVINLFYSFIKENKNNETALLLIINFKEYIPFLNNIYFEGLAQEFNSADKEFIPTTILPYNITLENNYSGWTKNLLKKIYLTIKFGLNFEILSKEPIPSITTDVSFSHQILCHIKKNNFKVSYKLYRDKKMEVENYKKSFSEEITPHLDNIFIKMNSFYSNKSLKSKDLSKKYFKKLRKSFLNTYILYKNYLNIVEEKTHLYMGSNNNIWSRALAAAVQNKKGEVNNFTHGEPIIYNWEKIAWMELALSDNYHEYSKELANLLHKNTQHYLPPNNNKCSISWTLNPHFLKIHDSYKNLNNVKKIRNIYIIGNAYRHKGFTSVTALPSPVQFYLERKTIWGLLNLGYEVTYQQHPGGVLGKEEIDFKLKGKLQISREPFEQTMHKADAFLFYYTRTSTFGPALCTNKPIILLDGGWENIIPSQLKVLNKRCTISTPANKKTKLPEFDLSKVMRKVEQEKNKANSKEFVEKYLLN